MKTQTTSNKANAPTFRALLQEELVSRCRRNANYSLRSFAKAIGIDASLLSKLLRGERKFTRDMVYRLGQAIDFPRAELQRLQEVQAPKSSFRAVDQLALDEIQFEPISDWTYFAILEVLLLENVETTAKSIARELGLSISEVHIALEKLQRMGRIEVAKNGRLVSSNPNQTWTQQKYTTEARKQLQKQYLRKAVEAIDSIDLVDRENASLTIAVNKKLLPEIKKRIEDFKKELGKLTENTGEYDSVYQICFAAYPLSQKTNKKSTTTTTLSRRKA